jgi:hypothetical protein
VELSYGRLSFLTSVGSWRLAKWTGEKVSRIFQIFFANEKAFEIIEIEMKSRL